MPSSQLFAGIEIGGTKLQLVTGTSALHMEQVVRFAIDPDSGAESIRGQIEAGWRKLQGHAQIAAIGVGFGGPVDWKRGTIRVSHQVSGWQDFNLPGWLQSITGKRVAIENDANAAALAEALHGSGKGYGRVFYMTIGSGIGGGLVIDGDIYHGRSPGEVEVGHLRLNKQGDTLEGACSGWAVNNRVKAYIDGHPGSLLACLQAEHPGPEATLLQPAIEQGDVPAAKIVEAIADELAFGLSHVVHLLHPDIIVVGGGLSLLREHLRLPLEQKLPHYVMQAFLPPPPVLMALLEENAVPAGALELAKKIAAV